MSFLLLSDSLPCLAAPPFGSDDWPVGKVTSSVMLSGTVEEVGGGRVEPATTAMFRRQTCDREDICVEGEKEEQVSRKKKKEEITKVMERKK